MNFVGSTLFLSNMINIFVFFVAMSRIIFEVKGENYSRKNPLSVHDGYLVFDGPVTARAAHAEVDDHGYYKILCEGTPFTSFSFDVGFNRGQSTKGWLEAQSPYLYIIGIEANARLVSHFEHSSEFANARSYVQVLNVAAGTKEGGVSMFNPGFGWANSSDTGSLFGFSDPNREKERLKHIGKHILVRNLRLDALLAHVPLPRAPTFMWDTMKLDVQGADVDAMYSAGDYIDNFVCVVGEFDALHYVVPEGFPTKHYEFLGKHKFKCVWDMWPGNSIWLNERYYDIYKKDPKRFGCHTVYDSPADVVQIIENYDKGGLGCT